MDPDTATRSTDGDAAQARLSAVRKGYLTDDPFISSFVARARFLPPRPPLINVGTFIRATAIDQLVNDWIEANDQIQIVSLGAGSDTRFWRLSLSGRISKVRQYVEVDFPENTARKAAIIRNTPDLNRHLEGTVRTERGGMALRSKTYTLCPCDLREPPSETLGSLLEDGTLISSVPCLFISECVFVYMPKEASDALVQWFAESFDVVAGVLYEMFGLTDSFGVVMKQNLMSRGVQLPGVDAYPTLSTQQDRFERFSYNKATALNLKTVRLQYVPRAELSRIASLEMLDEVEELDLVLEHYVICWGFKSSEQSRRLLEWELPLQSTIPPRD